MGIQSRLFRRAGRWTFRVHVPDEIQSIVGKKELWKSLGAIDFREAERLARVESVAADALFAKARAALRDGPPDLSPSDAALVDFARRHLAELERSAPPMPFDETGRAARLAEAEAAGYDVSRSVEDPQMQAVARRAAREAGIPISAALDAAHAKAVREAATSAGSIKPKVRRDASPVQRVAIPPTAGVDLLRITEAVQRALVEHFGREADRAMLKPKTVNDPIFAGIGRDTPAIPASDGKRTPSLRLGAAVQAFLSDVARAHLAPASRASYAAKLTVVVELIGSDRPVESITRADVRDARDVLLKLPPNASKRWPGVPLLEVAERAQRDVMEPMAPKTAMLHIEAMSGLFRWLMQEELAPRNPAAGLKGPALPEETDRRPFTGPELNKLFASPRFNGSSGRGWFYWLPRVALFTSARFAELIGLKVSDFVEVEGITCISIEPTEVRRLKTKGSRRLVPIHRELMTAGFLDHVKAQPVGGLMFPDVAGPKDMVRARNKVVGGAIRAVLAEKDVVFHSFRHTFKDAADAVMPREIVARLGGWEPPGGRGAIDAYGRATLIRKLADEMEKLSFAGLRL